MLMLQVSSCYRYLLAIVRNGTTPPSANQSAVLEASREVLASLAEPLYFGLPVVPFKVSAVF